MAKYGYDEKIGELIPQDIYEEYSLCALYSGLGIEFNDYMTEIVSKMLLAKNVALSNDKIKILADNIRKNQQEDDPKKEKENYLASYMVEKDGKVIDNLEEMREFVKENFLFVLQDDDQENAWISSKKDGVKLLSVSKNMLDFAENSSQIEGVVAHELGHYFLRKAYEKVSNSNIDETLADKHAVDMLYYLGKDPDEYRKVLERVLKLNEMNDVEAVILGVIDEHGSPKHRIQTIEDYEEVKYGDYIENFLEDAEKIEKVALDDASFMDFKGRIDKEYDEGKYIGYLEAKFMEDDKFSSKIVEGRIDWANVSYDDALDKLIELCNDENFKHSIRLAEAGKILSMSDTSSIVRDENHASKASKFFMRATDCVFLSIDKKGKSLREVRVDEAFEQIKKNDYKYNLSRVLLDEANEKGEELDAKGLVKKMEEVLAENGVVLEGTGEQSVNYNGRELYCGGYYDIRLLALSLDDDTKVLSEDIKNHRAIYAKSSIRGMIDEFDAMGIDNNRAKFISNADSLAFSLAYPDLDLGKYESKYYKCINDKQKSECEEKFFNIVNQ